MANLAEPRRSTLADQGEVREGLDVLHERRPASDALFERSRVACGRDRLAAVDQVHESALLPRQVRRRHVDHAHPRRPGLGLVPLLERSRDGLSRVARTDLHTHDHEVCAHRRGGEERAVQHQMGSARHQQRILGTGGLTFAAVGEHDRSTATGRDRAKLHRGGETGTSPAVKSRRLDELDQRFVIPATDGRRRRAPRPVLGERPPGSLGSEHGGKAIGARRAGGGWWGKVFHHHS